MAKKRYTLEQRRWDDPVEHGMPERTRVPASFRIGGVEVAPATVLAPIGGRDGHGLSPVHQECECVYGSLGAGRVRRTGRAGPRV